MGLYRRYDYFWAYRKTDMQRLVITLILVFLTLGSVQRPSLAMLLNEEQMISVLVDLTLAKAIVQDYTDDEVTASRLLKKNVLLIYQAHDIDADTFQRSYEYYHTRLEVMEELYEAVIKHLEKLEDQL